MFILPVAIRSHSWQPWLVLCIVLFHQSGLDPEFGEGHFRTITLPQMEVLEEAFDRLERFMVRHVA